MIESSDTSFSYRPCERQAFCRDCDGVIEKGEMMISGYSWRNRGISMHFHPECIKKIQELIPKEER